MLLPSLVGPRLPSLLLRSPVSCRTPPPDVSSPPTPKASPDEAGFTPTGTPDRFLLWSPSIRAQVPRPPPVSRMLGFEDELSDDALAGKLEGMKDVIEQVNKQFRDPDLTTFVCVCIPEFLSLYETERLVQELTKFEIDAHNIIINQNIFPAKFLALVEAVESKLLKARMRMQQKYIDQFYMLYDDFHITKLPLLPEEVCGVQALKRFSGNFLTPYKPAFCRGTIEELEQRVSLLRLQLKEAETELDRLRKGKQKA
ncbi:hypothetical protein Taro_031677, partial [Colocasia esculenta]|nr:hypothetical protein [Colocasia esculenta]